VTLVRIGISGERIASLSSVATIGKHGTKFGVLRLLVTANVVPHSLILVTLMMETTHSTETSVLK
jgi:hypothetical protein